LARSYRRGISDTKGLGVMCWQSGSSGRVICFASVRSEFQPQCCQKNQKQNKTKQSKAKQKKTKTYYESVLPFRNVRKWKSMVPERR
jgi:hypothetical protein